MKLRRLLVNTCILFLSAAIGLILCEFAARLFLNRSDFLGVEMVGDPVLGAVPSANAKAGFDEWGFRNPRVPATAEIVAIGDSHTFGNTAKMQESWPYVLGALTGRSVYNMAMGGYGPNQYYYLLKTKAISLKPRVILCGLYMGDDFENAFTITYGLDYWKDLRSTGAMEADYDIWKSPATPPSWHKAARVWLSNHSVVYQIVFHASQLGRSQGEAGIENAWRSDPAVTSLSVPGKHILEAFRPHSMLIRLDQQDPNVQEGMRITFALLQRMNELCRQNNIQFVVVMIPTKETVFSEYLEHNPALRLSEVLDKLISNERVARDKTFAFLKDQAIAYVDPLPALKASVQNELYARTPRDMHPGKNGYRVIARAAFDAMQQKPAASQSGLMDSGTTWPLTAKMSSRQGFAPAIN